MWIGEWKDYSDTRLANLILCSVCAYTFLGRATQYPAHYSQGEVHLMKGLAIIANALLANAGVDFKQLWDTNQALLPDDD